VLFAAHVVVFVEVYRARARGQFNPLAGANAVVAALGLGAALLAGTLAIVALAVENDIGAVGYVEGLLLVSSSALLAQKVVTISSIVRGRVYTPQERRAISRHAPAMGGARCLRRADDA
jgi:hypothetical protein